MPTRYIFIFLLIASGLSFPFLIIAQGVDQNYVPLVRLPGITDADFSNATGMVNGLIRITIVAAAFLAVLQIIRGGFTYITTEAVSGKGDAKKLISDALTGLLLILGSILILTLINPDILKLRLFNDPRPQREIGNYQSNTFLTPDDRPLTPLDTTPRPTEIAPNGSGDGIIIRSFPGRSCTQGFIVENGVTYTFRDQLSSNRGGNNMAECSYVQQL